MFSYKRFATILFVTLSFLSLPFWAQARREDETGDGAADLEQLKATVDAQGKNLATMSIQVNEVVSQFQTMNGDIGKAQQKNIEQDKIIKDSQTRLQVLEDKVALLTGQLQELRSEGLMQPKSAQLFREYKAYEKGLEQVNAGNYGQAVQELQKFQEENAKSIYTSYAQYWIGESYFMQSDFPMAIKEYQKLLAKNPKSAKAPTALYRQAMAFYNMQSFEDAKAFLSKVITTFPQSIEAVQANGQIKRINSILELKAAQEAEMKSVQ
jgi:tol-pal system protein YbgF